MKHFDRRTHFEYREALDKTTCIALQSEVLLVLPEADREPFLEHLALVAGACRKAAEQPLARGA